MGKEISFFFNYDYNKNKVNINVKKGDKVKTVPLWYAKTMFGNKLPENFEENLNLFKEKVEYLIKNCSVGHFIGKEEHALPGERTYEGYSATRYSFNLNDPYRRQDEIVVHGSMWDGTPAMQYYSYVPREFIKNEQFEKTGMIVFTDKAKKTNKYYLDKQQFKDDMEDFLYNCSVEKVDYSEYIKTSDIPEKNKKTEEGKEI